MARCPHNRIQQFSECCCDCGRNIYETDEEYLRYLIKEKQKADKNTTSDRIERLEIELGISHPGNALKVEKS